MPKAPLPLRKEALEKVKEYNYLGKMVCADPKHEREIRRRIGLVGEHLASAPK